MDIAFLKSVSNDDPLRLSKQKTVTDIEGVTVEESSKIEIDQ